MARICDEIKIVFRGPCERLFIAYKPAAWHVCSPSGKEKMEDSLSSVVAAKLGVSEDSIKFPSKLKIGQKGLVIGTTDEPMYSQICRMIQDRQCLKTYTCLVEDTLHGFISEERNLSILLGISLQNGSQISGKLRFNMAKFDKRSASDPNVVVDRQPGSSPHFLDFTLTSLDSVVSDPEHGLDCSDLDRNRYSVLELETRERAVDKHLPEILAGLGIKVVRGFDTRLREHCGLMQLGKIQIPHPILRGRTITSSLAWPVESWVKSLAAPQPAC